MKGLAGFVLVVASLTSVAAQEAVKPGNGVTLPVAIKTVKPEYTEDAKKARIQGNVLLDTVVNPDGSVTDVKVARSLDSTFGLDQQAIKAAKEWKFKPGMKDGKPVAVRVAIEINFTLK